MCLLDSDDSELHTPNVLLGECQPNDYRGDIFSWIYDILMSFKVSYELAMLFNLLVDISNHFPFSMLA